MKYIKGEVFPYTEKHLRTDNPNTSFPVNALEDENIRANYGVEEVLETAIPTKKGYKAVQGEFGISDGKKVEVWDLVPMELGELSHHDVATVEINAPEGHSISAGTPEFVDGEWRQTWVYKQESGVKARVLLYGELEDQIEFITENGLEAWQARVAEIKALYPKT